MYDCSVPANIAFLNNSSICFVHKLPVKARVTRLCDDFTQGCTVDHKGLSQILKLVRKVVCTAENVRVCTYTHTHKYIHVHTYISGRVHAYEQSVGMKETQHCTKI